MDAVALARKKYEHQNATPAGEPPRLLRTSSLRALLLARAVIADAIVSASPGSWQC
jgi:hypothetical protein